MQKGYVWYVLTNKCILSSIYWIPMLYSTDPKKLTRRKEQVRMLEYYIEGKYKNHKRLIAVGNGVGEDGEDNRVRIRYGQRQERCKMAMRTNGNLKLTGMFS